MSVTYDGWDAACPVEPVPEVRRTLASCIAEHGEYLADAERDGFAPSFLAQHRDGAVVQLARPAHPAVREVRRKLRVSAVELAEPLWSRFLDALKLRPLTPVQRANYGTFILCLLILAAGIRWGLMPVWDSALAYEAEMSRRADR